MSRSIFLTLCPCLCSLFIGAFAGGCSKCSEGAPPAADDGVGALYDKLPLGADESSIRKALGALAGLPEKEAWLLVSCNDRPWIDVLDLDDDVFAERSTQGRKVRRCTLPDAGSKKTSLLRSARVDFLDGKAVSASWSFSVAEFDGRKKELEKRLGAGTAVRLEERSAVGELQREALVWKFQGESWALIRGMEARVVRQSTEPLAGLSDGAAAPKKGEKVSLDDIGLGGGLNLDKPLPDVSDLMPKDAGAGR